MNITINDFLVRNLLILTIAGIGAFYDWKHRRVPNWLTLGSSAMAIVYSFTFLKFEPILFSVGGFFVGLILLLIPHMMGGMGAGDVKLLAALGSIVGYKIIIHIFIYTTLNGMLLGIIWILSKPERLKFLITTGKVLPAVEKKEKVPYAVAIFLGTISYIAMGEILLIKTLWQ